MPIYVTRPSLPDLNDYVEEIESIFNNHILINTGKTAEAAFPPRHKWRGIHAEYLMKREIYTYNIND